MRFFSFEFYLRQEALTLLLYFVTEENNIGPYTAQQARHHHSPFQVCLLGNFIILN